MMGVMDERRQSEPWTRNASWDAGRLLAPACAETISAPAETSNAKPCRTAMRRTYRQSDNEHGACRYIVTRACDEGCRRSYACARFLDMGGIGIRTLSAFPRWLRHPWTGAASSKKARPRTSSPAADDSPRWSSSKRPAGTGSRRPRDRARCFACSAAPSHSISPQSAPRSSCSSTS